MTQGLGFEETYLAFNSMREIFEIYPQSQTYFQKSLRAICCAKCLNWIDFRELAVRNDSKSRIEIDEFMHYARWDGFR
jgi:hypothetical protein